MSLLSRLRERQAGKVATATPATYATPAGGESRTVATVATVAVAKPQQGQTASPARVGADDTATASRWWLIHFAERDPAEVSFSPPASHAEILKRYPDAIAAEPINPVDPEAWEERAAIAEFDGLAPRADAERLAWIEDNRRRCGQCENLRGGICKAASPSGPVVAMRGYRPSSVFLDTPHRCEGFRTRHDNRGHSLSSEPWPGLRRDGGACEQ